MPTKARVRVFVSSTFKDLVAERTAVRESLLEMWDTELSGMEDFAGRSVDKVTASLAEVDLADVYIGIIGRRYGTGITQLEYHRALSRSIPCLMYLAPPEGVGPPLHSGEVESPEQQAGLKAFRDEAEAAHLSRTFTSPEDLRGKVSVDLHNTLPAILPSGQRARRHNLTEQIGTFVNREDEVAALRERVGQARLVTLTGLGGTGKTRVAHRVARALLETFEDGVWQAQLADVRDPARVRRVVMEVLGVTEDSSRPESIVLGDFLEERRLLLVLDNCEHLRSACADMATEILQRWQGVHVLAIGRGPLDVPGEVAWPLHPLRSPPLAAPLDQLPRFGAIRLFMDRASSGGKTVPLDATTAPDIAGICRLLDGFPLAIEIIAARARTLSVRQIRQRLEDRRLPRTAVQAAMDLTHGLLGEPAVILFRRLAVLRGSWTLDDAERACADDLLPLDDVLAALEQLVDYALVLLEDTGGDTRFRMLETVREYATTRLRSADESVLMAERHFGYCLALALEADDALHGPEQQEWLDRIEDFYPNFRVALTRSRTAPEAATDVLRLAGALSLFWTVRGHFTEGRQRLRAALDAAPAAALDARAQGLLGLATLAIRQDDHEVAVPLLEESLSLFRALADDRGTAAALNELGLQAWLRGLLDEGAAYARESLAIGTRTGDETAVSYALNTLGNVATGHGQFDAGIAYFVESITHAERGASTFVLGWSLHDLAVPYIYRNHRGDRNRRADVELAVEVLDRCLDVAQRQLADPVLTATALGTRGLVAVERGQPHEARSFLRRSLSTFRNRYEAGGPSPAQRPASAGELYTSLDLYDPGTTAFQLEVAAACLMLLGYDLTALALAGTASRTRQEVGAMPFRTWHERFRQRLDACRMRLSPQVYERAWNEGLGWSLETAIVQAIATLEDAEA